MEMGEKRDVAEDLALLLLHNVAQSASLLHSYRFELIKHHQAVRAALASYPFDRFTNWGVQSNQLTTPETDQNYFMRGFLPHEQVQVKRRIDAVDSTALQSVVANFCEMRYGSNIHSLFLFGGYVYGVTPKPDDLDLKVILEDSHVIENPVVFKWNGLNEIIHHSRKPTNKLGLTIIGRNQINATTQNNTVLRTAIIIKTNAFSLIGPTLSTAPVPISVLLYHAIEMVTWGFKLCFEADEQAQDRALWRIVEANYILMYINDMIKGPLSDRLQQIHLLKEHISHFTGRRQTSLSIFEDSTIQFRQDIFVLKSMIREMAIRLLDEIVDGS